MTSKWKIKRLRVYLNAQNALTFFKYKGFNPEVVMTPRTAPLGVSTTISSNTTIGVPQGSPTSAGIDTNVYPISATYSFGVNLTL
jgi:hypothetical protein